jgi:hypothetical protein
LSINRLAGSSSDIVKKYIDYFGIESEEELIRSTVLSKREKEFLLKHVINWK